MLTVGLNFKFVDKQCSNCGKKLILNNNRDIERKKYCSRACHITITHNEVSRKKTSNKTRGVKNIKKGHSGINHHNFGKSLSEATKIKQSETISKLFIEGKINNKSGYNRGHIITRFGKLYYRSNYELDFIKMCELDDNIISMKSEPFRIKMDNNRYYIPDFLINEKQLIEIKPSRLIKHNMYKIEQAKKYSQINDFEYKVITEKDLYNE